MYYFFSYLAHFLDMSTERCIETSGTAMLFACLSLRLLLISKDKFTMREMIVKYVLLGITTITMMIPIGIETFEYWWVHSMLQFDCALILYIITVLTAIFSKWVKVLVPIANILMPISYLYHAILFGYAPLMILSVAMLVFNIFSLRKIIPHKQPQE